MPQAVPNPLTIPIAHAAADEETTITGTLELDWLSAASVGDDLGTTGAVVMGKPWSLKFLGAVVAPAACVTTVENPL